MPYEVKKGLYKDQHQTRLLYELLIEKVKAVLTKELFFF